MVNVQAQSVSIATDISLLRNFTPGSHFTAMGQTVQALYHIAPKTTGYAWINYYTPGNFKNILTATARDSATVPQTLNYTARSSIRFRHISLGLRRYITGRYNADGGLSLYALGGFGLLLIKAANTYSTPVNAAVYTIPQKSVAGTLNFVRLTADVGLGAETLLGGGIYLYGDLRTWVQASRYPQPYLYNQALPRVAILTGGIRILFE